MGPVQFTHRCRKRNCCRNREGASVRLASAATLTISARWMPKIRGPKRHILKEGTWRTGQGSVHSGPVLSEDGQNFFKKTRGEFQALPGEMALGIERQQLEVGEGQVKVLPIVTGSVSGAGNNPRFLTNRAWRGARMAIKTTSCPESPVRPAPNRPGSWLVGKTPLR